MARVCLEAMNSINQDLEFTVETEDDFDDKKLPTLDFTIWQEENGTINHTYFQKNMKTPYVVMERSSIAKQQQYQILSNELTRRLLNVHDKNEQKELTRIVDQMTQELKNSGYGIKACQEIVARRY